MPTHDELAQMGPHEQLAQMEPLVPNIVTMLRVVVHDGRDLTLGWCDDQSEFEFGMDLILDGLERVTSNRGHRSA